MKIINYLKTVAKRIKATFIHIKYSRNNTINSSNILGKRCKLVKTEWGKYSSCNDNCIIINTIIGNYVNISWNVTIGPRNHIIQNFTTHDFIYADNEFINIANNGCFEGFVNKVGHDVWIGCNVIILPGIEIGNGAIIAAGSVVTKSIPPYAIVGGNPAKFIRWRFDENLILNLEKTGWFHLEVQEIIQNKDYLENIVDFNIREYEKRIVKNKDNVKTN